MGKITSGMAAAINPAGSDGNKSWNNGFCGCCSVKGCGLAPCCCPNFCCPCMPMMWADAMTRVKGKDYNYMMCCIGAQCCPVCTFGYAGMDLATHYNIPNSMPLGYPCCKACAPVLSFYQIFDTVLVREKLHMTMAGV